MKIAAALLYLMVTSFITIHVGQILFRNGKYYILAMLQSEPLTDAVSKILLAGYYLVNLGYVTILLTMRPPISNVSDMVASLATSIGRIMIILGAMHYFNILTITLWHKFILNHK